MNKKLLFLLIASYLLAFSINLMPAMKYPDLEIGVFNLIVSIVFIFFLTIYAKTGSKNFRIFSMVGTISGVMVYLGTLFEGRSLGGDFWDVLATIQYPFYFIFTTPLFGGNLFFEISHETYSLALSLIYALVFGILLYYEKQQVQIA